MTTTEQYLHDRLIAIGLNDETNTRTIYENGRAKEIKILRANNSNQSIMIPYTTPQGEIAVYVRDGKILPFERQRYSKEREYEEKDGSKKKQRYSQPAGSGVFTYMTPGIVKRVRMGEKIDTLFIVEGEIKALSGDVLGLDIIGLGGIQNFRNKEENEIDTYIKEVIEICRPDNVVLLFDADCLSIKHESEDKDLYTRLNNFRVAVTGFLEMMKQFDVDLYFSHIDEKFAATAKGLDDLLMGLKEKQKDNLKKELLFLVAGKKSYTKCMKLERGGSHTITRYFHCDNVNNFYEAYRSILQEKAFKYRGQTYFFNGSKLEIDGTPAARAFINVGGVYYRICSTIDEKNDKEGKSPIVKLVPTAKEDVKEECRNIALIPKFHLFVNIPDNTEKYTRHKTYKNNGIETVCYNRYEQVNHDINPGDWPNIEKFLRHIFSGKNTQGEVLYDFGLDMIQHAFFRPMERMPVLVLASDERNTGKSTYLALMKAIFNENAVILDNERLAGKFTDHFVDKLIVGVEEVKVKLSDTLLKERIKNYATAPTVWCEPKGIKPYEINNYMHLVMCTNSETDFMQIDDDENRFAIIKVPKLTEDDPFIMQKMREEIGHFLFFLKNRKYHYPYDRSRFGFDPKVYETEGLKRIRERTENRVNKEIKQYLYESFINFNVEELFFTPKDLAQEINREGGFSLSKTAVMDYLKYDLNMQPVDKVIRYDTYRMEFDPMTKQMRPSKVESKTGRPYKFIKCNFEEEE